MRIKLITEIRKPPIEIEIKDPVTAEKLVRRYSKDLEYRVLAVKVNNVVRELGVVLSEDCTVEFLDRRTNAANLIYQHSLSLIYLKAIEDVLGKVPVEIQNSLNKGLYTEIKTNESVTKAQVLKIEERMHEIVKADLPIVRTIVSREEAIEYFGERGYTEKLQIIENHPEIKNPKFYVIESYKNFFYGLMAPSTGYIEFFQLRKYRRGVILTFPRPHSATALPEYADEKKLCAAFGEAKNWHKLLNVSYLPDLNSKVWNDECKELILLSEALQEKKIAQIADMITKKKKRMILIAGPSSSGKTTFARRLCIQLKVNGLEPLYMGTDDYFVDREQTPLDEYGDPNYEDLEALDVKLFNDNMNDLLGSKTVDLPTFDFITGKKVYGERMTAIKKNQLIVIEGIHALNNKLTEHIPPEEAFKIYISPFTQLNIDSHNRIPTSDARLLRRMVRDYLYRGHSAQATIAGWPKVRKGEEKNIFPFNVEADVMFNSALTYELAVLKKHAVPLLSAVEPHEPEYSEAVRMLKFVRFFETIDDESMIPSNSIIREFIGGSVFAGGKK